MQFGGTYIPQSAINALAVLNNVPSHAMEYKSAFNTTVYNTQD